MERKKQFSLLYYINFAGSVAFQSIKYNDNTRSFVHARVSCTVCHLCMALYIHKLNKNISQPKINAHENGLVAKILKIIVCDVRYVYLAMLRIL